MKFCIPSIGDQIVLTKGWKFPLFFEQRNVKCIEAMGILIPEKYDWHVMMGMKSAKTGELFWYQDKREWDQKKVEEHQAKWIVTLPKGTILQVDRIYIRKGQDMGFFDSVSFIIKETTHKKVGKKRPRFWAKLRDVNRIMFKPIGG